MNNKVSCFALVLLFLASSNAAGVKYSGQNMVKLGHPFSISCLVGLDEPVKWTKDGKELPNTAELTTDERTVNDTIEAMLTGKHATKDHSGVYKCTSKHENHFHLRVAPDDTLKPVFDDATNGYKFYDLGRSTLTLTCQMTSQADKPAIIEWFKETETDVYKPISELLDQNRYTITAPDYSLAIKAPEVKDGGKYKCSLKDNDSVQAFIQAASKVVLHKFPKNVMTVEGEKLTIACQARGYPTPDIHWVIANETSNTTVEGSQGRIVTSPNGDGVPGAVLTLASAERSDAGEYTCYASNVAGAINATATVRVQDKYAALWPFLGICAEVFILCAVILVYEKRRNVQSAEREDSDTDHSPDRKK